MQILLYSVNYEQMAMPSNLEAINIFCSHHFLSCKFLFFLNKNLAMHNIKSEFGINLNTLEVHKPENYKEGNVEVYSLAHPVVNIFF